MSLLTDLQWRHAVKAYDPTQKVSEEKIEKIVMEEMQGAYSMQVPLIADAGWGNNWLEAH